MVLNFDGNRTVLVVSDVKPNKHTQLISRKLVMQFMYHLNTHFPSDGGQIDAAKDEIKLPPTIVPTVEIKNAVQKSDYK